MNKLILSIALLSLTFTSCDKDPVPNPNGTFPDPIELSGTLSVSRTLTNHVTDPSVPDYCISGDYFVEANLIIEAGVYIQMKNGSKIHVRNNGTFFCIGTSSDKVTIKGENNVDSGQWKNIHFATPSTTNQLVHTNISGGGNSSTYNAMVFIGHQGRALIKNCYISSSSTNGIKTESVTSGLSEISGCTISACGLYPINVVSRQVSVITPSNIGGGNGYNQIDVREAQLQSPATWNHVGFPYHINGTLSINSNLTVMPGTTFMFAPDAQINVGGNGSLNCIGTATQQIHFRGDTNTAGSWGAITFIGSQNSLNHFEYCEFLNGGNHPNYIGMIALWTNSQARVGNSSFTNSASWGIYVGNGCTYNDDGGNTFSGNTSGEVSP